jgi:hypothetical protein
VKKLAPLNSHSLVAIEYLAELGYCARCSAVPHPCTTDYYWCFGDTFRVRNSLSRVRHFVLPRAAILCDKSTCAIPSVAVGSEDATYLLTKIPRVGEF